MCPVIHRRYLDYHHLKPWKLLEFQFHLQPGKWVGECGAPGSRIEALDERWNKVYPVIEIWRSSQYTAVQVFDGELGYAWVNICEYNEGGTPRRYANVISHAEERLRRRREGEHPRKMRRVALRL